MEHIGIDVHKNQSQICILTSEGELIEKRIVTDRKRSSASMSRVPVASSIAKALLELRP